VQLAERIEERAVEVPQPRRSLELADVPWILGLMAIALGARLAWWSGYGLGDDVLYRHFTFSILENRIVQPDNTAYRFSWWFPMALSCRLLGLSEVGIIVPITVVSTLGIGLVYALGKTLWGRAGGVVAALLLIVHPLDFAWSTMLASDVFTSFYSGLAIYLVLRALDQDDPAWRRRSWIWAAASLWLAYHSKVSAVLLGPPLALLAWRRRARLDRQCLAFVWTAAALFGGSALVAFVFTGDPLAPYHAELSFQGLVGKIAVEWHRLTADVFWAHPRTLFRPNQYGDLLHSVYPHLLVAFVLLGTPLGLRSSLDVFVWLVVVFLGMQFNIQYVDGVWVSGFRNVRHGHVFVYPLVLLIAGYLLALRGRVPRVAAVVVAALVAFGGWQSVSAAEKTHVSFADRRAACEFLATLPSGRVYSDFQINTWASILNARFAHTFEELHSFDAAQRKAKIASITSGYLVTGGGREPYYGCIDCIPRASEVTGPQWRLLLEVPGPREPTRWRPEPLRVWQAVAQP
jgi:hypothetical protein